MLSAEVFLDSNVLLYACSNAPADAVKRQRAEDLILNTRFGLSTQVFQEFIANALRKRELGISEVAIDATLTLGTWVPVIPLTLEIVMIGVGIRRRYQVSHWDASIIAAAQALGCKTLYTEDLTHGQDFDGLRVLNPFLGAPSA
jgi:predicted nucleic acid-binding protein